jgi:cell wall-associated NlpC family hydrolase
MKNFLLLMTLLLVACAPRQASQQEAHAATIDNMRFHCDSDTTRINELLMKGHESGISDANALIEFYARQLLGTPYVAHTLEADKEILTINVHELDCLTFIETLYALARTTLNKRYSWRDYAANIENVRYRNGTMGDYSSRIHYMSEWIIDNHVRGNLVEVTPDLPHAEYMVKDINYMSSNPGNYRQLKNDTAMVAKIKRYELLRHRFPYLKRSWLNDKNVKAELRSGDFVSLVTKIEGLDVSHNGIIIKDDKGDPYLLDASLGGGKVMLESTPLFKFLERSKSNIGIRVYRMMQ